MNRSLSLVHDIIQRLDLNLKGLKVLTEVGSHNYMYTPLIAQLAGAEKVYAWTRDSRFGKADDIVNACKDFIAENNLRGDVIEFALNERPDAHIFEADIITNLGFIRPIDKLFVEKTKEGVVIPYMCEAWELREGDVDIEACKRKSVKVAGTWENHPDLNIFDGCGHLIAKLCFEAGFEIYQNRIMIVSQDKFGDVAKHMFTSLKASQVDLFTLHEARQINPERYDFILLADYTTAFELFDKKYLEMNKGRLNQVIHLSGVLNEPLLQTEGVKVYPKQSGYEKRMTRALDYLGPKPVIELHAAGLKVAQQMVEEHYTSLSQPITFKI